MLEIDILPASKETKGGDSILIRFGEFYYDGRQNQQTIVLIDGGYSDNADRIIKHIKNTYNTDKIHCVICTHPDIDHISGLIPLFESKDIQKIDHLFIHDPWKHAYQISRKIRDGRSTTNSVKTRLEESMAKLDDLLDIASKKGTNIYEPFSGKHTPLYGYFTILGPSEDYYCDLVKEFPQMHEASTFSTEGELIPVKYNPYEEHFLTDPQTSARNNSSAVILLNYNGFKVLFTGDAGVEGLYKALEFAIKNRIDCTNINYLQIPHHGSRKNLDETLLGYLKPKGAFVSAPWNSKKHPSRYILNYLTHHIKSNVYHVSQKYLRIAHNAPARPGIKTIEPLSIFATVYRPR